MFSLTRSRGNFTNGSDFHEIANLLAENQQALFIEGVEIVRSGLKNLTFKLSMKIYDTRLF
ncbi:protein of unknown function [Bartonella clarridgeiae 73]|uniref:Uncharacterized protein n=1 Tax=Bartonella clarridgeiae (strain CCUG 45776 / CIP 104772 / 73) TaxID=696125 RepID=E6YFR4_BARC7|nr:MAG: hypothetical protein PG977_001079 [Bartonella clarridgeiae]CBI75702.1 protein of unknown function [Bartonella clarridgeiae 73]